jgi:hypothetical protein
MNETNLHLSALQDKIYESSGCWVCNDLLLLKFREKYSSAKNGIDEEDRIQQADDAVKVLFIN